MATAWILSKPCRGDKVPLTTSESSEELVALYRNIAANSFLNWYVNPKVPEDAVDDFIAIGQGEDGPDEENERISGIAKYAIWMPTQTIAEAEEAEGHLYDTWVLRNTGLPPFANKNKPPKSKMRDNETKIAKLRLRQILNELRSLRD